MDKKAKSILYKTYWSSKGWKDEYTTSPEDFIYAKEKGLLSTRRLDWRSGIASYYIAKLISVC